MRCIAAKFVPRLLIMIKRSGMQTRFELREKAIDDPNFSRIITGDESWIYGYDPETMQQLSVW
jgi:hypothetical protein